MNIVLVGICALLLLVAAAIGAAVLQGRLSEGTHRADIPLPAEQVLVRGGLRIRASATTRSCPHLALRVTEFRAESMGDRGAAITASASPALLDPTMPASGHGGGMQWYGPGAQERYAPLAARLREAVGLAPFGLRSDGNSLLVVIEGWQLDDQAVVDRIADAIADGPS